MAPLISAAVALLAIGAACGSASAPEETASATPIEVPATVTPAGAQVPAATDPPTAGPAEVKAGNRVGNRAPEYALSLADGGAVTSESIVSGNRPVFLFFLATW